MAAAEARNDAEGAAGHRALELAFLGGAINSAAGRAHLSAIELDQRFRLCAGCFSRHDDINQATAQAYGVAPQRTYRDLHGLLQHERERIDAVAILTPIDQHRDQVIACLAAGVPVICEKALVSSSDEAIAIAKALEQTGGFLVVTYNYTGYPMLRELRRMVRDGYFGTLEQVLTEMPQETFAKTDQDGKPIVPQDWRLRDGFVPTVSLDLGAHTEIVFDFLADQKVVELVATSRSYGHFRQIVDTVMCFGRTASDMMCSTWYTKTALGYRNGLKVRLFGSERSAEWVQMDPEYVHVADKFGRRYTLDRASPEIKIANQPRYARFKAGHPAGFIEAYANYYADIADALTAYRQGRRPAHNDYVFGIDKALVETRVLEAMARSSNEKRWVNVE